MRDLLVRLMFVAALAQLGRLTEKLEHPEAT